MNEKDASPARIDADNMIRLLVTSQPELFKVGLANKETGNNLGEFISALRDRLTAMYQSNG